MSDHGIIMSGDNPRLILEGRKTQTRRIMNPQPPSTRRGKPWSSVEDLIGACPYGIAGDRLWVREKFALLEKRLIDLDAEGRWKIAYGSDHGEESPLNGDWRPSIHMPRWASQIGRAH